MPIEVFRRLQLRRKDMLPIPISTDFIIQRVCVKDVPVQERPQMI